VRDRREISLFQDVSDEKWNDWHWQWENRIDNIETLSKVISLSPEAVEGIRKALSRVRMAITPYYAV
jgi:lysine 2,3-aminomutase